MAAGDYLLAIDGRELRPDEDPYRLLRNKSDRPVRLTVNSKPTMAGARTVSFNPLTSESDLIYFNWVEGNRRRVNELSGGKLGYLHIPDMSAPGIREFIKWYYGQLGKEGLVVDVRANGGGNVSRMLIERLARQWLAVDFGRVDDQAEPYPDGVFIGPKIALLDENSASDGDIFPAMFREAGLGPLVGRRSWGGVVGISNTGPLIDVLEWSTMGSGTNIIAASCQALCDSLEYAIWKTGAEVVRRDEHLVVVSVLSRGLAELAGPLREARSLLERAVAEVMKKVLAHPVKLPSKPAGPIKTEKR